MKKQELTFVPTMYSFTSFLGNWINVALMESSCLASFRDNTVIKSAINFPQKKKNLQLTNAEMK